ncbi:hypothetical protein EG68_00631 [Paragonimus skrjabini miyazakii]|uniref:Secreted protein n=1 Tax=Paragonimus skrjabini miyazakii TaxID=59628 RepID=A0A8S9ZBX3_9TREM|nr:hypothetical protein EG68_00631 [Paragonimus skrjabini miyazakii]
MYFLQITFIIAGLNCILGSDETVYEEWIEPIIVPKLGARGKPRCPTETDVERYQQALTRCSSCNYDLFDADQSNYTILDVASQVVGWIQYYYTIQSDTGLCYKVLLKDQSIDYVDNIECPEVVMDCPELS